MKISKFLAFIMMSGTLVLSSCTDDDDPIPSTPRSEFDIFDNITSDVTWKSGETYVLRGGIAVESGATLTIEPGTIIKGDQGNGASATYLLIARGAKLMAEGTASQPIIFTSFSDRIEPGEIASPNLDESINGLWGGVIICGNAQISASNDNGDVTEVQIEGIPTSNKNGLYGGNVNNDNSGVLKYVSIRHGGTNIGSGNEINGLTLGGVGSETVIENVEVIGNQDDGIEWFGGTVNVTNAISWNVGDDGMDTDQSWSGTLSNFYVITPAGHCFELDGPEGSYEASHTITNGNIICYEKAGDGSERVAKDLINVDPNSMVSLQNLMFDKVQDEQQINDVTAAEVSFSGIEINVPTGGTLEDHVNGPVPSGVTNGNTSMVNSTAFDGWSWAAQAGKLN